MAVSDLTNTTWYFNQWPNINNTADYYINFTCDGDTYTRLSTDSDDMYIDYYSQSTGTVHVYGMMGWNDEGWRTITITGGNDVTNATLIAWIEANAEQQSGSTAKTQVGTSTIAKKMFGTTPIAKEVVNGVTVYEASAPATYTATFNAGYAGYDEGGGGVVYIKLNTAPTHYEYDYITGVGENDFRDSNNNRYASPLVELNVSKVYLWGNRATYNGVDIGDNVNEIVLTQDITFNLLTAGED